MQQCNCHVDGDTSGSYHELDQYRAALHEEEKDVEKGDDALSRSNMAMGSGMLCVAVLLFVVNSQLFRLESTSGRPFLAIWFSHCLLSLIFPVQYLWWHCRVRVEGGTFRKYVQPSATVDVCSVRFVGGVLLLSGLYLYLNYAWYFFYLLKLISEDLCAGPRLLSMAIHLQSML